MPPHCSRCARWLTCTCRGKNCCSWHRLSPGAKVADHGRAAQAGGRPEKTESERLHRPSRTYYLEDTGLFRVSLVVNAATIHRFGTVLETETDLDTRNQRMMMNVGSMYMYLMAHFGITEMKKRGGGSILDIASVRGYTCQRGVAAYSASNGAIYNVDGGLLPGIGVQ